MSSSSVDVNALHPLDARAYELERVDELVRGRLLGVSFRTKANRVRGCTPLDGEGWRTCKQRECPACSFRLSETRKWEYLAAIRRMVHPTLILVTLRSRSLDDLRATIQELRHRLSRFLRTRVRGVRGGLGMIEPKLSEDRHYWAVHGHVVVDVNAVPWTRVRADWHDRTHGRGRLMEDTRAVSRRSPFALARYLVKGSDACPRPGSMPPALLARLWPALFRLQLVMAWGPHVKRGRSGRGATRRTTTESPVAAGPRAPPSPSRPPRRTPP